LIGNSCLFAEGEYMENTARFGDVVEAADHLSLDEQETLLDILRRRINEQRRAALAKEVENADKDFEEGRWRAATPSEIMQEILS
jgi:hypothetical protein